MDSEAERDVSSVVMKCRKGIEFTNDLWILPAELEPWFAVP